MRESLFVLNSIFRSALDIWTIPAFSFAELKVVPFSQHTVQHYSSVDKLDCARLPRAVTSRDDDVSFLLFSNWTLSRRSFTQRRAPLL